MYRRALALEPRRWLAYVNLLELMTDSLERWQRRDEILALLDRAMLALREDPHGRYSVLPWPPPSFERSVGRLAEARRRLEQLPPAGLAAAAAQAGQRHPAGHRGGRARAGPGRLARAGAAVRVGRVAAPRPRRTCWPAAPPWPPTWPAGSIARHPTASGARFLRARALAALARHDEARRELLLLLQLRPSHAGAWRLLGTILADHGGVLEAERADEALRKALALEPSWHDLREVRRQVALKRAQQGQGAPALRSQPPSPRAQALLAEAQRWMAHDVPAMALSVLAAGAGRFARVRRGGRLAVLAGRPGGARDRAGAVGRRRGAWPAWRSSC